VYGHGQPNIPVAPGKICTIEFEPGETLDESGMELGDTVNWKWSKHQVMRADKLVSYLTLSPKYSGLDTPMTVFTNLRAYYFRLLSDTTGYIERVGFTYPDDDVKRKQEAERAAKAQEEAARIAAEKAQRDAEELRAKNTDGPIKNTDYSVQVGKKAAYFRPVLIGDNGAHTKIQLPESCRHRDLPTLTLQNHLGTEAQPFAFDEKTLTYTVNGLFDAAELSVGVGKNKISIRIVNNSLKG
jgi:P-type conjugative transfer protein TrbG